MIEFPSIKIKEAVNRTERRIAEFEMAVDLPNGGAQWEVGHVISDSGLRS